MGVTTGIDPGTTNSCVAIMEGAQATVVTNPEEDRTPASIVDISKSAENIDEQNSTELHCSECGLSRTEKTDQAI
ncbi:Hsp70 family protein [Desulfobacter curvatus]|uniref:Hsp70 family protein n=1 Tax=Desulfobacter curvatus TaxID=2290 RepID=UPI000377BB0C|nr:Hsp70 family protein [Desulfobacter curvatus]